MTATNKRVSVPSAVGENRRRIQILEAVAASGGSGIQFNSGTYGADNVGDWLMIETDDSITIPFSLTSNVDPTSDWAGIYSEAHNNKYGALFTVPVDSTQFTFALNVINDATGAGPGSSNGLEVISKGDGTSTIGIDVFADAFDGTGHSTGIALSSTSASGFSKGISVSSDAGSGASTGVDTIGRTTSGLAIGLNTVSRSTGGGTSVGIRSRARASGGGVPYPYEGYSDANVLIFRIDDSGNIHIPVAANVIADL